MRFSEEVVEFLEFFVFLIIVALLVSVTMLAFYFAFWIFTQIMNGGFGW